MKKLILMIPTAGKTEEQFRQEVESQLRKKGYLQPQNPKDKESSEKGRIFQIVGYPRPKK